MGASVSQIRQFLTPLLLIAVVIYPVFLGNKMVPFFLGGLVFSTILEKSKKRKLKSRLQLLIPFVFTIAVYLVYTLLAPDLLLALKILERQISLILIPLVVVLSDWPRKRISFLCISYVSVICIISLFSILVLYQFNIENSAWIDTITSTPTSKFIYLQYKYPHVLNTHPTYWSYLILVAILIINSVFLKKEGRISWSLGVIWFFLSANLFYLAGRTPIFIYTLTQLFFFFSFFRVFHVKSPKRRIYSLLGFASALLFFTLICTPLFVKKTTISLNDERTEFWPLAITTIKNNYFVLGEGVGQANEVIKKYILENGDEREGYNGYDLHNQYLRHYVEMGILGISSLFLLLYTLLKNVKSCKTHIVFITISVTIMFILSFTTESLLIRLKGIVFFSAISSLLLVTKTTEKAPRTSC
ncbi:MAG: O-antigen ligase family protein [Cyanobacteria bacterium J06573_2]